MHRHFSASAIGFLVLGLLAASPVWAGDSVALQEEVTQLKEQVAALSAQQSSLLQEEVAQYLETNQAWRTAEGGGKTAWDKITLNSRLTTVVQGTLGLDPANRTGVDGDVDLDFTFQVNDNLQIVLNLTANTSLEFQEDGFSGIGGSGFEALFSGIAGATGAGLTDGIGVNGTAPTDPGSITVYEAIVWWRVAMGDNTGNIGWGAMDPRRYFAQNAFADDENRQFLNNAFDDPTAVPWLSDASGRTVFGFLFWMDLGSAKAWRLSAAWFNTPGQWFNQGQLFIQIAWKGEVSGRTMNVRVFGFYDSFFDVDAEAGGGVSWDWLVSDKIGLFIRLDANGSDTNPVTFDGSIGACFMGLVGSRPDDQLGIAVGFLSLDNTSGFNGTGPLTFAEDTEFTVEVYYRFSMEGGKMEVTPGLQFISDPGGGSAGWSDDALFMLFLRIFVPF